ncbi:sensor histidine kinase [Roseibium denhamense]|uniref:histidine kinase n=1 Tax=Roseibium denhamense TaxID=76305 RepID=A0ABY1P1I1_9HYPH|nr:ATP-binding protein [Roseibium denhamense]MTI07621.1 sensor histidine kinase [Roseibium denhamense]SMP24159.1 two-component system, NtrC family, C4-dicarboxylate transport sensor histidine kinase DctB [Roseibium denhamense]
MVSRWFLLLLPPVFLVGAAFVLVQLFEELDRDRVDRKAGERLTLYRQTILGEYQKFRYLPYMIARDPRATAALGLGHPVDSANQFLEEMAENSGADLLYVMNRDGTTLAASNWREDLSLVGNNYGFRPYFTEAMEGREGQFFAIGLTTGRPGLFLARPTPVDGDPLGVAVVKVDTSQLEHAWADGGERVFLSDANGVIFLSSQSDWRYRTLSALPQDVLARIFASQKYANEDLRPVSADPVPADHVLRIDDALYRHNVAPVGLLGWNLHYLVPIEETRASALPIWTTAFALCLFYAVVVLFLRGRRLRKTSVRLRQESDELKELNTRLIDEVQERRRVERQLLEAQRGLARSNRLAAVGEMSAAVVHELSQPLAALRMFVAGTRKFLEKGDVGTASENLDEIDSLQLRMASLTQELKRFSRPAESQIKQVDLRDSIRAAEKITRPRFQETGTRLHLSLPDEPILLETAPLRIEQVLVNLLRNGAEAAAGEADGEVRLETRTGDESAIVIVGDNGPGIPDGLKERIFDPFFSTKANAGGMGLGLAISMRLAEDLGGSLSAEPNTPKGARFVLRLPAPVPEPQADPAPVIAETEAAE